MELEQRVYQGARAREVLENEQFQAAFEVIEKEIHDQWMNSSARDPEGREKLWLMLKMLQKVKLTLEGVLDDGKIAAKELEHLQSQSLVSRARGWISRAA
jgi:hypothetical protein